MFIVLREAIVNVALAIGKEQLSVGAFKPVRVRDFGPAVVLR